MTYMVKQSNGGFGGIFDDIDVWIPVTAIQTIADNVVAGAKAVPAASVPASEGNLNVSASGGTSISMADFKPGTCKPMNWIAYGYVTNLQNQLNRVATVKGLSKIGVDGQIGPGTLGLLKKVKALFPTVMGDPSSCLYTSADADVIGDQVKDVADSLNAPTAVAPASSKAATIVTKSGLVVTPPGMPAASIMGAFNGITPMQGIALAGIAGGIGYLLLKKKKGKRK